MFFCCKRGDFSVEPSSPYFGSISYDVIIYKIFDFYQWEQDPMVKKSLYGYFKLDKYRKIYYFGFNISKIFHRIAPLLEKYSIRWKKVKRFRLLNGNHRGFFQNMYLEKLTSLELISPDYTNNCQKWTPMPKLKKISFGGTTHLKFRTFKSRIIKAIVEFLECKENHPNLESFTFVNVPEMVYNFKWTRLYKVKTLCLKQLKSLRDCFFKREENHLEHLEELHIEECSELKGRGWSLLSSKLKILKIINCNKFKKY